jgi:phosphoserine phosphatase
MPAAQNVIAVIFDFDDTLTDDSTTRLLEQHHIDTSVFWKQARELVEDGWNPTLAYIKLLLDNVGDGKPLGKLDNARLREFGGSLRFYQGIPRLFRDLRELVGKYPLSNPSVEFYVISGGLEEVIRGSQIAPCLKGIWGCRFAEDDGVIRFPMNVVSFTEKTKYLFEINKGFVDSRTQAYRVNEYVRSEDRRVPFDNMIYVGDGLTDVPCFSLIEKSGGVPFGVFDPKRKGSPKKAFEQLVAPKRVKTMNAPRYRASDELGALLRAAVAQICSGMEIKTGRAV